MAKPMQWQWLSASFHDKICLVLLQYSVVLVKSSIFMEEGRELLTLTVTGLVILHAVPN